MHVLPEELNAAVLEALAAEAAGVKLQSSVAGYVLSVRMNVLLAIPHARSAFVFVWSTAELGTNM